ncbi:hypothetical protein BC829DRAFT_420261 [Chytridium lagenaria]|nr:hypothetical protein BC829DRAFT_420261 [Chytridium lagenaria]
MPPTTAFIKIPALQALGGVTVPPGATLGTTVLASGFGAAGGPVAPQRIPTLSSMTFPDHIPIPQQSQTAFAPFTPSMTDQHLQQFTALPSGPAPSTSLSVPAASLISNVQPPTFPFRQPSVTTLINIPASSTTTPIPSFNVDLSRQTLIQPPPPMMTNVTAQPHVTDADKLVQLQILQASLQLQQNKFFSFSNPYWHGQLEIQRH